MKIKLMNQPDINQNLKAWKNSRPNETRSNFDDIIGLDLPVNEFAQINLFIESSMIEREIFTTLRNHVMWAQTSRVQNVFEFEVDANHPSHLADYYEDIRGEMIALSDTGVRQDEYRLKLPLMSLTKYSISTTIRGIVKAAMYFEHLAEETILTDVFRCAANELFSVLFSIGIDRDEVCDYKLHKFLDEELCESDFGINSGSSSINDGVIVVSGELPFHLRSQLVRHRGIGIKDNLFQFLQYESIWEKNMEDKLQVVAYGIESDFKEVVSKRSCWVAHYKIWGNYLNLINKQMGENSLPCAGGHCPFNADAMLRFEGKDPNPPCPIHCNINKLDPTLKQIDEMRILVIADNREMGFWGHQINHIYRNQDQ